MTREIVMRGIAAGHPPRLRMIRAHFRRGLDKPELLKGNQT